MKTCIVVVNYFSHKKVERLMRSVPDRDDVLGVVVDNSDDADEFKRLSEVVSEKANIRCLRAPSNMGFSCGTNLGIRESFDEADCFLILNPDTTLADDFFDKLHCATYSAPDCVLSPKGLRMSDGSPWSQGGKFYWLRGRADVLSTTRRTSETEFGTCACLFVPKQAIVEVGLLDEDFFLGGEEWDYSLRLRRAGWSIIYMPSIIYYHEVSGTHEKYGPKYFYIGMRTKVLFAKKHYQWLFYPWLMAVLLPMGLRILWKNSRMGHGRLLHLAGLFFLAIAKSARGIAMTNDDLSKVKTLS